MQGTARRLLTGALTATAIVAGGLVGGLAVAPGAAQAATVTGTVDVGGTLTVRTGPSASARAAGSLRDDTRVQIACYVHGSLARGTVRTTDVWDRLTSGRYISHAYVRGAAPSPCGRAAAVTVPATVKTSDGPVNLRSGASRSAAVKGTAANGTALTLSCMLRGDLVSGTVRTTNQWNRLRDGRYISHAYTVASGALSVCPGGQAPSTSASNQTNAEFIAAAVPGAQRGWREYGVPPSVTIAQSILESGWGRSALALNDRNYFGIKCQKGFHDTIASGCRLYNTTECRTNGSCFGTTGTFRTYRTVADSFRDHGKFLRSNSRYAHVFQYTKQADKFLLYMWDAGYATDPEYFQKVRGIMRSYDLYRYDTWR
jgi:flagellar protein FlgJ